MPSAFSVPMRRYAIAGLKTNCGRSWRNIANLLSLHTNAKSALCARRSSARWSADCRRNQQRLSPPARVCLMKRPKLCATATEALRNGDRILERVQGESFFLTKKITKMQRAIVEVAAERIAAALIESDDVDASSIFSETLTQMIAERVAATLRPMEQTRDGLGKAMDAVG